MYKSIYGLIVVIFGLFLKLSVLLMKFVILTLLTFQFRCIDFAVYDCIIVETLSFFVLFVVLFIFFVSLLAGVFVRDDE